MYSEQEIILRRKQYDELVQKRKGCFLCADLINPNSISGGSLDSNELGPWSRWQNSLFPDILVIGQDFSDQDYFERHMGKDDLRSWTNMELKRRLNDLGYALDCGDKGKQNKVFLTNSVLCLKSTEVGMQGKLNKTYPQICGQTFLKPLIELLKPQVIIVLGQRALDSVREILGLPKISLKDAVHIVDGEKLKNGSQLFALYHLNRRTKNLSHRSEIEQGNDWQRLRLFIKKNQL